MSYDVRVCQYCRDDAANGEQWIIDELARIPEGVDICDPCGEDCEICGG